MKRYATAIFLADSCLLLFVTLESSASELVAIYALVDKVEMEPNEKSPQTIQVWGAFSTDRDPAATKRGYLYFRAPFASEYMNIAVKEWMDLKAVAGTGQAVAFGQRYFYIDQMAAADAYAKTLPRVRPASEKPTSPDGYPLNIGVSKLTNAAAIDQLKHAKP